MAQWGIPATVIILMAVGYPYLADFTRGPLLRLFPPEGLTLAQALAVVFGGPAVLFAIVLGHESGHALAGMAAGFRFEMMAAGPFVLRSFRTSAGRGLTFGIHGQPALLAGYSVCLPPACFDQKELRRGMLAHIIGGPVASLAVGLAALAAALLMPAVSGWATVIRALLMLLGFGSLLVGLATALPTPGRSLLNDGARWLQLVRAGDKGIRDLTLLTTSSQAMAGKAPRNWDGPRLRAASHIQDSSVFEFWSLRYLWLHHWDSGRLPDASQALKRALRIAAGHDHALRSQAALDAARFCTWTNASAGTAALWLELARGHPTILTDDAELAARRFFEETAGSPATP
ncbi:MAG: hypothetical protein ACI9W4_002509 [Rhodothermales bacterium]